MSIWTEGVSAIVSPTPDPSRMAGCLSSLQAAEVLEVLVLDPGGEGNTTAIARDHGAVILRGGGDDLSALGHAVERTRGSACWYLDPGCRVPKESAYWILEALDRPDVVGGYFRVRGGGWRGCMSNFFAGRGWLSPYAGLFWRRDSLESMPAAVPKGMPVQIALLEALRTQGRIWRFSLTIRCA